LFRKSAADLPKRRTKGDGGLIQRHDHPTCPPLVDGHRADHKCQGRWVGTIDVTGNDQKKRRKYIYGRTAREARLKLAAAIREKEQGTLVVASMTVEAWLDYWLENIAVRRVRPQTLRGYRSKVNQYLKPHLGRHRLTSLRPEHIRAMHDAMRAQGLAEASVRQAHAILQRALVVAVNEGKLGINPAERMDPPGTETKKREQLTPDQARQVLDTAGDDLRWWLALFYGMRQGEVLGLRWRDIDMTHLVLRVEQTLQTDTDGKLIFGPPKSESSRRPIPILPWIEVRVKLHHINAGSPAWSSTELVFANAKGGPIQPKADWKAWRDLLDRATQPPLAPLPQIALHAARNTAASLMEAAGIPDRLAAQILGHSNVQMTHGYQAADIARMRQGLASVGEYLAIES
jgi:integrase